MNETKKSAIRFQGFSDEWKQSRVGELIEDYTEKTVVQNQYPVLTSSQQQGIVRQEEYFADRQVTTNDNVGYFVLPFGYFTYRSRSDTDVFVFNRNDLINKGIISYYYPVFAPKNCDSNFLLRRLNYGIKKQLSMAAEGTGQKVLAHNKFKDMIVDVPDEEEQIKIGATLEYVDKLIAQHQSKLEKFEAFKASMLEKMFPKDGADVPEIRFKGFNGVWEKREWKNTIDISTEMVDPRQSSYENLPHVAPGNIESFTGRLYDNIKSVKEENLISGKFHFYAGDIVYGKINPQLGKYFYACFEGLTSADAYVLNAKNGLDQKFLFALLQSTDFFKYSVSVSKRSGMPKINRDELNAYSYYAPSEREQSKIGQFFLRVDALINLYQKELEKLHFMKKALLEKMFV